MNSLENLADKARLLAQIDEAAEVVAPLWPLSTFIAVNPLWDLRQMGFEAAVAYAAKILGIYGYPSPSLFAEAYRSERVTDADLQAVVDEHHAACDDQPETRESLGACRSERRLTPGEDHDSLLGTDIASSVDWEVSKWCGAYLAGTLPTASIPSRSGFYRAWRAVVVSDPAARSLLGKAGVKRLVGRGDEPEDAILSCFATLGVADGDRVEELALHLARMPGWSGHAKWRSRWAGVDDLGPALKLVDFLAVRLCYETELLAVITTDGAKRHVKRKGVCARGLDTRRQIQDEASVWLLAYEHHYRDWLLKTLAPARTHKVLETRSRRAAQAVFCIDVRSEGMRRHLEAVGDYETFGFAGFFALPIRYLPWGSKEGVNLCPVLLKPTSEMAERPSAGAIRAAGRQLFGRQAISATRAAFDSAKKGIVSPFVLAEAGGYLAAPVLLAKTLDPTRYAALRSWLRRIVAPVAATDVDTDAARGAMSDEEQALFAETALTTMGLTDNFAPIVLLCGHGSTTENNPYASSLDCGACGGNRGGQSARAAAAIFNRDLIRDMLLERGIEIPDDTVFVAAEHDTATDEVTLFDHHLIAPSHRAAVDSLRADLARAGRSLADERIERLPNTRGQRSTSSVSARSSDWAQVQPEWGLARNAAFIVAPRSVSAGVDLECRCFLHSYDSRVDPDGVALETILTAPMVVAHWINAQYYFSTVDPEVLSSGDKTVHNIVAGIGVVQGVGGDLQVGLPIQSLFDGERAYHEPMRLLTLVQAPRLLLEAIVDRNPVLRELFDGEWVHLAQRDDESDEWRLWRRGGAWLRWVPARSPVEEGASCG